MTQSTPEELRVWIALYESLIGGASATSENMKLCAAQWEADRAEIARLQELAYLGEHHFPDQTYKARLEELALDHASALSRKADLLLRAERAEAALEQARALAEKWADMKYNGDLTTAVYHGCAEELAAVLASGGAA